MDYADYVRRFRTTGRSPMVSEYGVVIEKGRPYPLLVIAVPGLAPERSLIVTCGFHGDETAGPLTVMDHLEEIVDHARAAGVGLRVYPCINPSGFEGGTRYNASGEAPNNDFLRYEIAPGVWKDDLPSGATYLSLGAPPDLPKETAALRRDLASLPAPAGALDIHQDAFISDAFAYAYIFGDRHAYLPLCAATEAHAPMLKNAEVDSGYENANGVRSDGDGLIVYHDGSITDYFFRQGSRYTATLETTTRTPPQKSTAINLIWICGFVDLIAGHGHAP